MTASSLLFAKAPGKVGDAKKGAAAGAAAAAVPTPPPEVEVRQNVCT